MGCSLGALTVLLQPLAKGCEVVCLPPTRMEPPVQPLKGWYRDLNTTYVPSAFYHLLGPSQKGFSLVLNLPLPPHPALPQCSAYPFSGFIIGSQ